MGASDVTGKSEHTLLVDIYQEIGRIGGQNQMIISEQARAAVNLHEVQTALSKTSAEAAAAAANAAAVAKRLGVLEPNVSKMTAFRTQVSVAVVVVTAVVTGAINLIWLGITHLDQAKAVIRDFLR